MLFGGSVSELWVNGGIRLVVSNSYPFLAARITIRSFQSKISAYIDTGFDGYLIAPEELIMELGEPDYLSEWELGDGSIVDAQDYLGELEIIGLRENIEVRITAIGTEFIIGRAVIDRYCIMFDHGMRVIIER